MFRKWFSYVPPQDDVQQKFTGVQEHTHQHPGLAAMKHPLFPVSGQEPVPCHPPVPSLPEDQSLGSSEPTQKETGGVFPMRVLPGSMLGKGRGVGRIAASVVRWVRAVPLGIKHDLRRVGGLCAPNGTRTQAYQTPPKSAAVGGRQLNYCCQSTAAATEANPGAFGGLFGCSQHPKSKAGRTNIFS